MMRNLQLLSILIFLLFDYGSSEYFLNCEENKFTSKMECHVHFDSEKINSNYSGPVTSVDFITGDFKISNELLNELFIDLTNLTKMDINDHAFQDFNNQTFEGGASLLNLYINNCSINHLGDFSFQNMKNLKVLNLAWNKIESLSANVFYGLDNLNRLHLHDNKLSKLHALSFDHLPNLLSLYMGNNKIKELDENIFVPLKKLKRLGLERNSIELITGSLFKNNTELKELDLGNNNIQNFTKDVVDSFKLLNKLDLTNNDCVDQLFEYHVEPNHPDKILKFVLFPFCNGPDFEENYEENSGLIMYLVGPIILCIIIIIFVACVIWCIRKRILKSKNSESETDGVAENDNPDFSNLIQEYTDQSTVHGIKYLGERKRHWTEKSFWIAVFVVCVCISSYHIYRNYSKWKATPVIIGFDNNPTDIYDIPFPAVTLCSESKMRHNLENATLEHLSTLSQVCPNFFDLTIEKTKNYSTFQTKPEEYSDILEDLRVTDYVGFKWKGYDGSNVNYFAETLTDAGYCKTFNLLSTAEIFNNKTLSPKFYKSLEIEDDYNLERNSYLWSFESGYHGSSFFKTYPLRSLETSANLGFHAEIYNFYDSLGTPCEEGLFGYKLIVNNPHEWPQVSKNFIQISFNRAYNLVIKPHIIKTSDTLKSYSPYERQCYYPHEHPLKYFNIYTKENCEFECLADFTLRACDCVMFYMPRKNGTRVCNFRDIDCTNIAVKSSFIGKIVSQSESIACDCFPTCNSVQYKYDITQTELNLTGTDEEEFKKIEFDVYFEANQFVTLQRNELFGLTDFISNCGGLLGLFMGMSMLSFAEVIYYFTIRCACNNCRKKTKLATD